MVNTAQPLRKNLFDTLDHWLEFPEQAYSNWISDRPSENSTKTVYRTMWGKFCRFLSEQKVAIPAVESKHIDLFFVENHLIKAHRHRYIRLIEAVYVHLYSLGLNMKNPGRTAAYERLGKGKNDKMAYLNEDEIKSVEQVIRNRFAAYHLGNGEEKKEKKKGKKKSAWKSVRDAAIAAAMLGGGGSVSSVIALSVNCTNTLGESLPPNTLQPELGAELAKDDGGAGSIECLSVNCTNHFANTIRWPREGHSNDTYDAFLLPIASFALNEWLPIRQTLQNTANTMFPAHTNARGSNLTATPAMHPSSVFRAVKSILNEAGITGPRCGGQTLRNSYAATLISLGYDDDTLATTMGFINPTSATAIRASILNLTPPSKDDWLNDPLTD